MASRWYAVPAAAALLVTLVVPAAAATASGTAAEEIIPGVTYERLERSTSNGDVVAHLLTVNLRQAGVGLDLLRSDAVAEAHPVSELADAQGAVAGVNGDFFNISQEHDEAPATKSAVGPSVAGRDLKAAVPNGQRFGPGLADGTSTQDVFGVGTDGDARVGSLALDGLVRTDAGELDLVGLNQYAVAVNGIGAFTTDWGSVSRMRAVCGTDTDRKAPCSDQTSEVVVTGGKVASVSEQPGDGAIAEDTVVLVGREDGAKQLDQLVVGDQVAVEYRLDPGADPAYGFAVGGAPILRDGAPLSGVDNALAPRTGAGASLDGDWAYLLAVDGRSSASVGVTITELAEWLAELGADDGVNLDGGGSTTLVAREAGADTVTVRNDPSDGAERQVPNGIAVTAAG